MKVLVTGTRGIPNIPGGIESHCEELYKRMVNMGVSITLTRRKSYVAKNKHHGLFKGIHLVDLGSLSHQSLEAISHTILSVLYARFKGFKFIHIHAIGPALAIPLARLLGLKVILTHHGPDYDRQKWGKIAKRSLRIGEWCGAKFANEIIVISKTIKTNLKEKYNRDNTHLILNAVKIPALAKEEDFITSCKLEKKKYIIAVGRFVPEKGWHDLLNAIPNINKDYKIVFVGDTDHPSSYSENIKLLAKENNVVLTGYIKGKELQQIYSHAALFVMPSYHEGLPIALLEAMSYNLNTVVSNIPANLEIDLPENHYFEVGNVTQLADRINQQLSSTTDIIYTDLLKEKYDWDTIALQTYDVYYNLMEEKKVKPNIKLSNIENKEVHKPKLNTNKNEQYMC